MSKNELPSTFCRDRYGEVEKLMPFCCKFTTAGRKQIFQWIVVNLRFFFTCPLPACTQDNLAYDEDRGNRLDSVAEMRCNSLGAFRCAFNQSPPKGESYSIRYAFQPELCIAESKNFC